MSTPTKPRAMGWVPDLPDHRDLVLNTAKAFDWLDRTPAKYDMRPTFQPVYDQGQLGSCTANAVCAVLQYTEKEQTGMKARPVPSRLFHYYNTRVLQGTVGSDSGASIRNAVKAAVKWGFAKEALWPYTKPFAKRPPAPVYAVAADHKLGALGYLRVPQTLADIKTTVAANNPVVFGFSVYESFDNAAKGGIVPMPSKTDDSMVGGHAIVIVGYDDVKKWVVFRNSWGSRWGDGGYGYMPYDYVLNGGLASDFWTVMQVATPDDNS